MLYLNTWFGIWNLGLESEIFYKNCGISNLTYDFSQVLDSLLPLCNILYAQLHLVPQTPMFPVSGVTRHTSKIQHIISMFTCVTLPIKKYLVTVTQIMSHHLWLHVQTMCGTDYGYDHVLQCTDMHMMFDNMTILAYIHRAHKRHC